MFLDQMQVVHVLHWKTGIARLIAAGRYSPTTANGWLAVLRVIAKPFDDVSRIMRERVPGFVKTITPKSMRRTNKDLLRQEGVSALVAQSINSHHDPKMHAHYSTISDAEKTGALAKVIRLFPSPPEPTTSSSAGRASENAPLI